ncbi:MAG: protein-disulfide reductase DsbD family protein [Aquabacterium sp.]|uniref:protein-disulfide reductase DsbD family protein n=1 Tax=Aquabacterium sp. TaxID=1872578 RepID=UPI003BE9DDD0
MFCWCDRARLWRWVAWCCLAVWVGPCWAVALEGGQNHARTEQVEVQLIPETEAVVAGGRLTVGVRQRIASGWHTYWRNPGDSGMPTRLSWQLPPKVDAGEIQWPVPQRFDVDGVINYGYAEQVTLLSDIVLPASLPIGSVVPLQVDVSWLVCRDLCIPQKASLHTQVRVVSSRDEVGVPDARIAQAREQLPMPVSGRVTVTQTDASWLLHIPKEMVRTPDPKGYFFPTAGDAIVHGGPQRMQPDATGWTVTMPRSDQPWQDGRVLEGVLVLQAPSGDRALQTAYAVQGRTPSRPQIGDAGQGNAAPEMSSSRIDLPAALLLALLGGMVLNLMPCVFPVLSIKALALLQQSVQAPRQVKWQGVAYTAGVLSSFTLLATVLIILKAGGRQVGWGFQFHSPLFVLMVAYLMFVVGLSLSGVVSVGASATGLGQGLASRSGWVGSFFAGVLATVVATPCTAPFMGGAMGFALTQSSWVLLAIFLSLGLGLALPYLILSIWPAAQRWLPRPGVWMEHLKQGLAFPMYGAAAWLIWVLSRQVGADAAAIGLSGMVVIAFIAWAYDRSRQARDAVRHVVSGMSALGLVLVMTGSHASLGALSAAPDAASRAESGWASQPYSEDSFEALRRAGKPVFLNFTASWCITCLVNERVALSQPEVQEVFQERGVAYLKGDWTRQDATITAVLRRFGRSGVPLYVYFPPGRSSQPVVLPQILTPGNVVATILDADQAAPSR